MTFDSSESLANVLDKVQRLFPVKEGIFSRLLFCPEASLSSRNILITREVRSADDYAKCIRPFKDAKWTNALLRFAIVDAGNGSPRLWSFGESY